MNLTTSHHENIKLQQDQIIYAHNDCIDFYLCGSHHIYIPSENTGQINHFHCACDCPGDIVQNFH